MRLLVQIAYKGTRYRGWQRQASTALTIQQVIEESLSKVLKFNCIVSGCGRTDAEVHASNFYFHFDLKESPKFDLCERMNRVLPTDIRFIKVFEVDHYTNARFSATSRVYNYFFHHQPNPYLADLSTFLLERMDINLICQAAQFVSTQSDFRYFCRQPEKHRTTICHVNYIRIYSDDSQNYFRVEISANRFLRGMIRIIMARLFELGKGNLTLDDFKKLFDGTLSVNFKPAYPQGLFLTQVDYDVIQNNRREDLIFPHNRSWNLIFG